MLHVFVHQADLGGSSAPMYSLFGAVYGSLGCRRYFCVSNVTLVLNKLYVLRIEEDSHPFLKSVIEDIMKEIFQTFMA